MFIHFITRIKMPFDTDLPFFAFSDFWLTPIHIVNLIVLQSLSKLMIILIDCMLVFVGEHHESIIILYCKLSEEKLNYTK